MVGMSKYKVTILIAVLFTIPLFGYFVVNGYWWLFDGNDPISEKMFAAFAGGCIALTINVLAYAIEDEQI
jgi:hypothetical protein